MLEVICKQMDFSKGDYRQMPAPPSMAGEPCSQSESPPGTSWTWPAASGYSGPAVTLARCVYTLGLVIRMVMKLG